MNPHALLRPGVDFEWFVCAFINATVALRGHYAPTKSAMLRSGSSNALMGVAPLYAGTFADSRQSRLERVEDGGDNPA